MGEPGQRRRGVVLLSGGRGGRRGAPATAARHDVHQNTGINVFELLHPNFLPRSLVRKLQVALGLAQLLLYH